MTSRAAVTIYTRARSTMRRMGRYSFALALAANACAGEPGPPDDVIDADALPGLELREQRRIGSATDPDVGFVAIGPVAVDDDGLVYVFEGRDRQIRVYDAAGELLRAIGGPGAGPGEFSGVNAIGVVGDTLWAIETLAGRIHIFDHSGTHLSTSTANAIPTLRPRAMVGDGLFSSETRSRGEAGVPRVLFTAAGEIADTVGVEPVVPPPTTPQWVSRGPSSIDMNGVLLQVPRPPPDGPLWVAFDDGSAVIDRRRATDDAGAEFTVTRFTASADTAFHLPFRYQPGRYEGAVLDTIAMRPVARAGGDEAAFQAVRNAVDYPTFQSPIYRAWPAQDSALWLRREDDAGPSFRWIVVDRLGSVRGIVALGRSETPVWARADTLWVEHQDDLGIPWLVRYGIERR